MSKIETKSQNESSQGIIARAIKGYKEVQMALVYKIINNTSTITDETGFLDEGTITARIEKILAEYEEINREFDLASLNQPRNSVESQRLLERRERAQSLEFQLIFYSSNRWDQLESCLKLAKQLSIDFQLCLQALQAYQERDETEAFHLFHSYFQGKSVLLEHFLINKVYGTILYNLKQYEQASTLLRKAVDKRPEDIECHRILQAIYRMTGQEGRLKVQQDILRLLEGIE